MALQSLPLELVGAILAALPPPEYGYCAQHVYRDYHRDLARCATVNKQWHAQAQALLYRRITVHDRMPLEQLFDSLARNRHNAAHIEELHVPREDAEDKDPATGPKFAQDTIDALKSAPNLRELRWSRAGWPTNAVVREVFPGLHHLRVLHLLSYSQSLADSELDNPEGWLDRDFAYYLPLPAQPGSSGMTSTDASASEQPPTATGRASTTQTKASHKDDCSVEDLAIAGTSKGLLAALPPLASRMGPVLKKLRIHANYANLCVFNVDLATRCFTRLEDFVATGALALLPPAVHALLEAPTSGGLTHVDLTGLEPPLPMAAWEAFVPQLQRARGITGSIDWKDPPDDEEEADIEYEEQFARLTAFLEQLPQDEVESLDFRTETAVDLNRLHDEVLAKVVERFASSLRALHLEHLYFSPDQLRTACTGLPGLTELSFAMVWGPRKKGAKAICDTVGDALGQLSGLRCIHLNAGERRGTLDRSHLLAIAKRCSPTLRLIRLNWRAMFWIERKADGSDVQLVYEKHPEY